MHPKIGAHKRYLLRPYLYEYIHTSVARDSLYNSYYTGYGIYCHLLFGIMQYYYEILIKKSILYQERLSGLYGHSTTYMIELILN